LLHALSGRRIADRPPTPPQKSTRELGLAAIRAGACTLGRGAAPLTAARSRQDRNPLSIAEF
jgi:hypothetical protein